MTSTHTLLIEARAALEAGRRQDAGRLLARAVRQEPGNFRIWLLLAGLAPTLQDSANCISRAAALAPDETAVADAQQWLADRRAAAEVAAQAEEPATPDRAAPTSIDIRAAGAPATHARSPRWLAIAGAVTLLVVLLSAAALLLPRWPIAATTAQSTVVTDVAAAPISAAEQPSGVAATSPASVVVSATPEPLPAGASAAVPTAAAVRALGKPIVGAASSAAPDRWTPTPSPTPSPTPLPTATPAPTLVPTFVSGVRSNLAVPVGVARDERWIDINLTTQTLAAYEGNRLVFNTYISSGLPNTPTVTGQFRIYLRFEAQTMDGRRLGYDYFLPNVPYVMYFYEDYALHGTYWHSNFGTPMSHGCVNMETGDAQWIFAWAGVGTLVNVHY